MSTQEGGDVVSQLVTGEAVVLQVRIARMPTRALACAIDVILQVVVLMVLIGLLTGFLLGSQASEALAVVPAFAPRAIWKRCANGSSHYIRREMPFPVFDGR